MPKPNRNRPEDETVPYAAHVWIETTDGYRQDLFIEATHRTDFEDTLVRIANEAALESDVRKVDILLMQEARAFLAEIKKRLVPWTITIDAAPDS